MTAIGSLVQVGARSCDIPGTRPVVLATASTPDRFDERSLVEAARHDADAFAALYRRYVDRVHAYAYRRSGSQAIADDVTSATFEKALRGLDRYRWREPGIGPWLFRIASNELVDAYRRDDRQGRIVERLQSASPATFAASGHEDRLTGVGDEVRRALERISPRYQRALTLRYFADLSNEEAAAAMGVSRATMAVVLHRAGIALRKAIEVERAEEGNRG